MHAPLHILVIDNYDSFTYNLVQALGAPSAETDGPVRITVRRNDEITVDEALALAPTHVVISPGPGAPSSAGVSIPLIRAMAGRAPILGVCLGHQAMAEAYGGTVSRAPRLMHGKASPVHHDGLALYAGLSNPFTAGRYHSLAVAEADLPGGFIVTSRTGEGEVMGIRHRTLSIEGVQFHPESVLTPEGDRLLRNFLVQRGTGGGAGSERGAGVPPAVRYASIGGVAP